MTTTEPVSSTIGPASSTLPSTSDKVCGKQELFDINGAWFCNEDNIKNGSVCKLRVQTSALYEIVNDDLYP